MTTKGPTSASARTDAVIAASRRDMDERSRGYRELALKMYPWICGRCRREFTHSNLRELTVHHRNHDHDFNPADGSNWELLCLYCHDNEHSRQLEARERKGSTPGASKVATGQPLADLKALFAKKSPD